MSGLGDNTFRAEAELGFSRWLKSLGIIEDETVKSFTRILKSIDSLVLTTTGKVNVGATLAKGVASATASFKAGVSASEEFNDSIKAGLLQMELQEERRVKSDNSWRLILGKQAQYERDTANAGRKTLMEDEARRVVLTEKRAMSDDAATKKAVANANKEAIAIAGILLKTSTDRERLLERRAMLDDAATKKAIANADKEAREIKAIVANASLGARSDLDDLLKEEGKAKGGGGWLSTLQSAGILPTLDIGNVVAMGWRAARTVFREVYSVLQGVSQEMSTIIGLTGGFERALSLARMSEVASEYQQSLQRVQATFGKSADQTLKFVDDISSAFGRSKVAMTDYIANFQAILTGFGLGEEASAKMSQTLIKMAMDLSTWKDVPMERAVADLESGLQGYTRTLWKYGISVRAAAVEQELLRMGLDKTTREASTEELTIARLNVMIDSMTKSQGNAVRELGFFQTKMEQVRGVFTDLAEVVGRGFNDAILKMVDSMGGLEGVRNILTPIFETISEIGFAFVGATGEVLKAASDWVKWMGGPKAILKEIRTEIRGWTEELGPLCNGILKITEFVAGLEFHVSRLLRVMNPLAGPIDRLKALRDLFRREKEEVVKEGKVSDGLGAFAGKLEKTSLDSLSSSDKLAKGVTTAAEKVGSATTKMAKDATTSAEQTTKAAQVVQEELNRWVQQSEKQVEQYERQGQDAWTKAQEAERGIWEARNEKELEQAKRKAQDAWSRYREVEVELAQAKRELEDARAAPYWQRSRGGYWTPTQQYYDEMTPQGTYRGGRYIPPQEEINPTEYTGGISSWSANDPNRATAGWSAPQWTDAEWAKRPQWMSTEGSAANYLLMLKDLSPLMGKLVEEMVRKLEAGMVRIFWNRGEQGQRWGGAGVSFSTNAEKELDIKYRAAGEDFSEAMKRFVEEADRAENLARDIADEKELAAKDEAIASQEFTDKLILAAIEVAKSVVIMGNANHDISTFLRELQLFNIGSVRPPNEGERYGGINLNPLDYDPVTGLGTDEQEYGGLSFGEGYSSGGVVQGPPGRDRVPAWLTSGEVVLTQEQAKSMRKGRSIVVNQTNHINAKGLSVDELSRELERRARAGVRLAIS